MTQQANTAQPTGAVAKFLNGIERVGNKLPDPAIIFLSAMLLIWLLSWLFSTTTFDAIDPRTGEAIIIHNLLSGDALAGFLASMVKTFTGFAPASLDVEAESPRLVAPGPGLGQLAVKFTDGVEQLDVGGGVRAGGASNRSLVDVDCAVEMLESGHLAVCSRIALAGVELAVEHLPKDVTGE